MLGIINFLFIVVLELTQVLIASELNIRRSRFNRARLHFRSFATLEDGGGNSHYSHQGDLDDPIRFVGKVQPHANVGCGCVHDEIFWTV